MAAARAAPTSPVVGDEVEIGILNTIHPTTDRPKTMTKMVLAF